MAGEPTGMTRWPKMCDQRIHVTSDSTFREPHPPFSTLGDDLPTTAARASNFCFSCHTILPQPSWPVRDSTSSFLLIAIFLGSAFGSKSPENNPVSANIGDVDARGSSHCCKYTCFFTKDKSPDWTSTSSTTSLELQFTCGKQPML